MQHQLHALGVIELPLKGFTSLKQGLGYRLLGVAYNLNPARLLRCMRLYAHVHVRLLVHVCVTVCARTCTLVH